jgi:hypothetical protein
VIVSDADQAVVGDLGDVLAEARRHDVSLLLFPALRSNLLALISATVCVANVTEKARAFFAAVQTYLLTLMEERAALSWHLDQAALVVAYLASPDVDFHLLPPGVLHNRPPKAQMDEQAVFWSVTYSVEQNARKLKAGDYLQVLVG